MFLAHVFEITVGLLSLDVILRHCFNFDSRVYFHILIATDLTAADCVLDKAHGTGELATSVKDIKAHALFIMTVDIAAHIVSFNIYFIVILIILKIVYLALKPRRQPCGCVYLRHLFLLCILYMYCSRLYCMRLLKMLFSFGERLLIVFALVHGHGYRFV